MALSSVAPDWPLSQEWVLADYDLGAVFVGDQHLDSGAAQVDTRD
ncbi:hypothetical protein [Ornithinimicrobium sp. INDO-MA30-4]|nr:hypothetical protein [Ornithinimicrobium sp. INDO-MA30-4]